MAFQKLKRQGWSTAALRKVKPGTQMEGSEPGVARKSMGRCIAKLSHGLVGYPRATGEHSLGHHTQGVRELGLRSYRCFWEPQLSSCLGSQTVHVPGTKALRQMASSMSKLTSLAKWVPQEGDSMWQ